MRHPPIACGNIGTIGRVRGKESSVNKAEPEAVEETCEKRVQEIPPPRPSDDRHSIENKDREPDDGFKFSCNSKHGCKRDDDPQKRQQQDKPPIDHLKLLRVVSPMSPRVRSSPVKSSETDCIESVNHNRPQRRGQQCTLP